MFVADSLIIETRLHTRVSPKICEIQPLSGVAKCGENAWAFDCRVGVVAEIREQAVIGRSTTAPASAFQPTVNL